MKSTRGNLDVNQNSAHKTLANFFPKQPDKTLSVIENVLDNNFKDIDSFLILSTQGNGGTHLLNGILNKLKQMNKKTILYSAEKLRTEFKRNPLELESKLMQYKYIGVDDYNFFNHVFISGYSEWIQDMFNKLIQNKIKLIITFTESSIDEIEIPDIFLNSRMQFINSDFPKGREFEIIEKIFQREKLIISKDIINLIVTHNFNSVRMLEGFCYSAIAHFKLRILNQ